MKSLRRFWIFVLCVLVGWTANPLHAGALQVRDSLTGAAVDASLLIETVATDDTNVSPQLALAFNGKAELDLPTEPWRLKVEAEGYRGLSQTFSANANSAPITILLDPISAPPALMETIARAAQQPERAIVHGYVRDAHSAKAIAQAQVRLLNSSSMTWTDAQGYFMLELAQSSESDRIDLELLVQAQGRADTKLSGQISSRGATQILLLIDDAAPSLQMTHGLDEASRNTTNDIDDTTPLSRALTPFATQLTPPATIRVGFNDAGCTATCCGSSCSNACVMSLETYVRRGLDSEWIASWNTQSLRAGSIAYRSYGASHTLHPRTASYDICSSACCQVNDAGTSINTDNAAARTPGLMLTRDDIEPYRAEYSAENNSWDDPDDGLSCSNVDLSCGNGFAGSPSAGWPCLTDAVGSGRGCFGHGRGMSQWGTQRWAIAAQPKRWKWIVNHYFNDNSNESGAGSGQRTARISTPLQIASVSATPQIANPGATLTLDLALNNLAGAAHTHLMIGASLYRSGVGYLSDPAHDSPLSLTPGIGSGQRQFVIPANAPSGSYDLIVSLYIDIDENGAISSDDLAMTLRTEAQHVVIGGPELFANGFE